MVKIDIYLNDGANWQARGVLAYLSGNWNSLTTPRRRPVDVELSDTFDVSVEVGRFENLREQGYVFTLLDGFSRLKSYAVYEHRNSDQLCVLMSKSVTLNTPSVDDMFGNRGKYDYDKSFGCGCIRECAEWILDDMAEEIMAFEISEAERREDVVRNTGACQTE